MIRPRLPVVRYILPLVLLGICCTAAHSQAPTARLNHIFPAGGQTGKTVDITIAGGNLDEASSLIFSHPLIKANQKTTPGNGVAAGLPVANQFSVEIPDSVEPGIYEVRAFGRFGLSTPRRFSVGAEPEVICNDQNRTHDLAMPVGVGTVINGKSLANARQYFKFAAKKSEKITLHCQSFQIDSRLNPVLGCV